MISLFHCQLKVVAFVIVTIACCTANDSPGFFLKVTKNVPRLGREAEPITNINSLDESLSWFNDDMQHSHPEGGIRKRMMLSPAALAAAAEREYSVVKPVSTNTLYKLLERDLSDNLNFVFWKDFDRALQMDNDLYEKVISLGRRPDQSLRTDLNLNQFAGNGAAEIPVGQRTNSGFMYYPQKGMDELYGNQYDGGYMQNRL